MQSYNRNSVLFWLQKCNAIPLRTQKKKECGNFLQANYCDASLLNSLITSRGFYCVNSGVHAMLLLLNSWLQNQSDVSDN